jgi:Acyl-coenzyme A synthetases/AMP-(fatty) acid ligases
MDLLGKFLKQTEFKSYEDLKENYEIKIPENFNFGYDVIDEYARLDPDKPALIWYNNDSNTEPALEKHFTFGELSKLSNQAANVFRNLGVKKGDAVMLMLRQRPEVWISIIALCKLGAISIPATFQLTPKDIVYRCNAASVKLICAVDDDDIIKNINAAKGDCPTLLGCALVGDHIPDGYHDQRALMAEADDKFDRVMTDNKDFMLIYFSSGTTGMPKMVAHDFTYPIGHITTAKYWQQIQDCGRHLTYSDSGWAKFAWGKIYGQWIAGAVIVAFDESGKFQPLKLLEAIDHLKLTTFCAPPTIYRFLIKEDMSKYDFSTLTHCCTAGEPLNPEVSRRFKEFTGHEIFEGFGQTETTVMLANFGFDEIKYGSTGKPTPLYDIEIVDEEGNVCEDGVVGSIVINTNKRYPTGLFREYYKDDEAMSKAWKDGVYNTGDTAWRDSDGYFWFEGRNDDVIKCSGYRIGPFEVESALLTHPAVLECAITAVPDPIRGQIVKATVVLTKDYAPSDELRKELQNHVKKVTAPYKYPRVLDFVAELPKTIGGKIKRAEIRKKDVEND